MNIDIRQDYYNHMLFKNQNGRSFRWISLLDSTDDKETRLDFCGSRHSDEECSFYSYAYDVSGT
jgi:hypothetical protein